MTLSLRLGVPYTQLMDTLPAQDFDLYLAEQILSVREQKAAAKKARR